VNISCLLHSHTSGDPAFQLINKELQTIGKTLAKGFNNVNKVLSKQNEKLAKTKIMRIVLGPDW
jgi:hypothetical protein